MKALILTDNEYKTTVYTSLYQQVIQILEQKGYEVTIKEAGRTLHNCIGCFGCWVKTPGECVIRDDMTSINRLYVNSDAVIFLSPVVFGQFSANIKNVFDRLLPRLLPFFIRKANGSTAHPLRYAKNPQVYIIGYGNGLETEDIQLFKDITIKHHPEIITGLYQGVQDKEKIETLFMQKYIIPPLPQAPVPDAAGYSARKTAENEKTEFRRKKVVFVNGSPRAEAQTASASFIARAAGLFDDSLYEKETIQVRKVSQPEEEKVFDKIKTADAVIFVFPLYVFCLPGLLTGFLRDYADFVKTTAQGQNSPFVYTVINCGFPEPYINTEAAGVIKSFCRHTGMKFRSSILIGGGVMITNAEKAPPVKKTLQKLDAAFLAMTDDIQTAGTEPPKDVLLKANFPVRLFFFIGCMNWKREAKHNGLQIKNMYDRPYSSGSAAPDREPRY
jgi:multimeric flavodoxin WrbA